MWNLFKKINAVSSSSKVKEVTKQVSAQLQIIAIMEEMINKLNVETLPMPELQTLPIPQDVKALIDAGFINHRKVQAFNKQQEILKIEYATKLKIYSAQSNERTALKNSLKLLLKARRVYGPDTLLIPLEQFMQICKKHNLVCGTFDQYTGDIPVEKLQEIVHLQLLNHIPEHTLGTKITKIIKTGDGGFDSSREYHLFDKHFNKDFPILRECYGPYVWTVRFLDNVVARLRYMEFERTISYYFIAAPEKMMSGKIQEVYEPNKDPIVWGLAGNNVLIFTRWGEEANDEVLQRYEAFNQKLDAFAQSLK